MAYADRQFKRNQMRKRGEFRLKYRALRAARRTRGGR